MDVLDTSVSGYRSLAKHKAAGAAITEAVIMWDGFTPSAVYAAKTVP